MIVESLTPVLEAVPGTPIVGRIRVVNDSPRDANYQVRVVGIDLPTDWRPIGGGAVPAGTEVHVEIPIVIPDEIGFGRHPVAIEVVSDQAGDRSVLASMTVSVESVAGVLLRAEPSVVRGRASGKFRLSIENRQPTPVDLELVGSGTDISAQFKPPRVVLQPGERAISKGKLRGKRRWSGDEEQHFVTLTARGRASSQSITTRFAQRSMVPWRFRTLVAAVLVISLWLAGALVYVWYQSSKAETVADGVTSDQTSDTDGTGDGDGAGDGAGDADGAGAGDGAAEADGPKVPTETTFGGAVTLADGSDPSDVTVSLDEIPLGQAGEGVAPEGFGPGPGPAKIWSARYGPGDRPGISSLRQTDSIRSVEADKDGTWRIPSVALRRNYELVFSLAGYDTQSFVVTPPDDGSPVEVDVELQPAIGAIAGVVREGGGPLGGVTLVATDGDLVFTTTSSTDAGTLGEFSFSGLSTPAVYTVTATRPGFGTEVVQFDLSAGQQRAGELISMRAGVGTILGSVLARQPDVSGGTAEQPFGGVTITVSDGDLTRTVTTLTEGAVGTFAVPGLPIPGTYTVAASAPNYGEASLTVTLAGDEAAAQFRLVSMFATLRGLVVDADGEPISGAGITLVTDELTFSSNTVSEADVELAGQFMVSDGIAKLRQATSFGSEPGEFLIRDLPPGEYRLQIVHFEHAPYSVTVELAAGEDTFLPIEMAERQPYVGPTGTLTAVAKDIKKDSELDASDGVKFWLRKPGEPFDRAAIPVVPNSGKKVQFTDLPLGSYILRAKGDDYFAADVLVNIGEGDANQAVVMLRPYGSILVTVTDPVTGDKLGVPDNLPLSYDLVVQEVRTGVLAGQQLYGKIQPDDLEVPTWTIEQTDQLRNGLWRIVVDKQPPGYLILPQALKTPDGTIDTTVGEMEFRIDNESPAVLKFDLVASRFPTVTVSTYEPDDSDLSNVKRLVDPAITVELRCDGVPPIAAEPLPTSGNGGITGEYAVSKELLSETPAVLSATSCSVVASGAGYGDSAKVLDTELRVSSEPVPLNPYVSLVVLPPPVTITGRVAWFDGVEPVYVPDAVVKSTGLAIVGYPPTEDVDERPIEPVAVKAEVTATWDTATTNPSGTTPELSSFTLDQQVYGSATYTVTSPNIAIGSFEVTIDGDDAEPLSDPVDIAYLASTLPPIAYDFTLTEPDPGVLEGCLTVATVRVAPEFAEALEYVGATPAPATTALGVDPAVAACVGEAPAKSTRILTDPASAGVWTVDYRVDPALPAGDHPWYAPLFGQLPVTQRIDPGQTQGGFDLTLVENGTITLTVESTEPGPGAPDPELSPTYVLTPYVGDAWDAAAVTTGRCGPPDTCEQSGTVEIRGVPVDVVSPLDPTTSSIGLTVPGFDVTAATLPFTSATTGSADIDIALAAGQEAAVTVTVEPLGEITGSIKGYVWRSENIETQGLGLLIADITVEYQLAGSDWSAPGTAELTKLSDDEIGFSVGDEPEGSYEFRVRAANPSTFPYRVATGDVLDVVLPPTAPYPMTNAVTNPIGTLRLELKPAQLAVHLFSKQAVPLLPAEFDVTMKVFRSDGVQIGPDNTPGTGAWPLDGSGGENPGLLLQPGSYRLELSDRDPLDLDQADQVYPASIQITLGASGLQVDVILPPTSYSLTVDVMVVNSQWSVGDTATTNRLPVPSGITVTRSFDAPDAVLTGGGTTTIVTTDTVPGTEAGLTSETSTTTGAAILETLQFPRIPSGLHIVTPGALPTGYAIKTFFVDSVDPNDAAVPQDGSVLVPDPNGADPDATKLVLVLVVDDVDVTVNLSPASDNYPDLDLTLTFPASGTPVDTFSLLDQPNAVDGVYTFEDVPPRADPYLIAVTDPLHTQTPLTVLVNPPGTQSTIAVTMTATKYRLEGALSFSPRGGPSQPLAAARVTVFQGTTTTVLAGPVDVTTGRYEFDLATAGQVRIEVVKLKSENSNLVPDPLYGPKTITLDTDLGKVYDNPITVLGNVAVSGTVALGTSGAPNAPVIATRTDPASPPLSRNTTTDGSGVYRFEGDNGLENGTWTIGSSLVGWGTGSTNLTVTDSTQTPTANIAMVARAVTLTITAQRPDGSAVAVDGVNLGPDWVVNRPATGAAGAYATVQLFESGRTTYEMQTRKDGSFRTQFTYVMPSDIFTTGADSTETIVVYEAGDVLGLVRTAETNKREGGAKVWLVPFPCPGPGLIPDAPDTAVSASNTGATKGEFTLPASTFDLVAAPFDGDSTFCLLASDGNKKDQKSSATLTARYEFGALTFAATQQSGQLNIAVPVPGPYSMSVEFTSTPTVTDIAVGTVLRFEVTATNTTSGASITGVVLSWPSTSPTQTKTCAELSPASGRNPAETCVLAFDHSVTQQDIDNGKVTTTVAHVSDQTVAGSITRDDPIPKLSVEFVSPTPDELAFVKQGDVVTYKIRVTNTGTVALTGVTATSSLTLTSPTNGCNSVSLAAAATCELTGTYTVTAADRTARQIVNTATADSGQTLAKTAIRTLKVEDPRVVVNASVDPTSITTPGTLTYTVTVHNTGNVDLASVSLTTTRGTAPTKTLGDTDNDGELDVGETWTYSSTYTVTQADINAGSSLTATFGVNATPTPEVTGTLAATTTITQTKSVAITSSVTPTTISTSTELTYTVTVHNTGNVDLHSVSLTATLGTPVKTSGDANNVGVLDVGETWTYTWAYTPASGTSGTPVVNTVTFAATPSPTVTGTVTASTAVTATFPPP